MCTAITFSGKGHYFGRNLDLEYSYNEEVTILPRRFPLDFRNKHLLWEHFAWIGMATIADGYPLYYDATNEFGLSIAALNFPGNACYFPASKQLENVASFEIIPWIMAQCKTVSDARKCLSSVNIWDIAYSEQYPTSALHWIIADQTCAITVESTKQGLQLWDNPIGVLTNNPPFDYHMHHLTDFLNLRPEDPTNPYADVVQLMPYSRGQGAMGLPGDLSSASRFIKAAYTKLNALHPETPDEALSQFFHILTSVEQQAGCVKVGDRYEKTVYSSCCNMDEGIYYYSTYNNRQITGVQLSHSDLDGNILVRYPLRQTQRILFEN